MPSSVLVERYELRARIGSGGMATVWRAFDRRLGREVAVKVLSESLAADKRFRHRFEREAHHIASLAHPNIVVVHDFGVDGDQSFIVMELVNGKTLRQLLAESSPLPPPLVADLGADILAGLGHAHEAGILHRDIKPSNILVTEAGVPKLADFGIAKGTDETVDLTDSGALLGTISYASPEQLSGDSLGPSSDLYSLGCVLYECLASRPPFVADSLAELIALQQFARPEPLQGISPKSPVELRVAIMRALEKAPKKRYDTASEMRDAIARSGTRTSSSLPSQGSANPNALAKRSILGRSFVTWLALVIIGAMAATALALDLVGSSFTVPNLRSPPASASRASGSVSISQSTLIIKGHGFGSYPSYIGNRPCIEIIDTTADWSAGHHVPSGTPTTPLLKRKGGPCGTRGSNADDAEDPVSLRVSRWTDTRIVISGFVDYGVVWDNKKCVFHAGDNVVVCVWNAQSGVEPDLLLATVVS